MRRGVILTPILLGILLLSPSRSFAQPGCSDPCRPGSYFRSSSDIKFYIADALGGSQTDYNNFVYAVSDWQNAISSVNGQINLSVSSGDVNVSIDSSLVGTGTWGVSDWGNRTMHINPEVFGYPGASFGLFLHEIGHFLGFADVTMGGSCGVGSTVMLSGVTGSDLQNVSGTTSADGCSTYHVYGVRDESPIVVRLDSGRIELTGPEVFFDLGCTGTPQLVGWTSPGIQEGFLVFDRDGDGKITSGHEMFGNFTPLSWDLNGPLAENGFIALAWFDDVAQGGNGDGWITSADLVFDRLRVWIDSNHDGVTDPGELHTLTSLGIDALSTQYRESRRRDQFRNEFRFRGWIHTVTALGEAAWRDIFDVFLVHN
jgi:hypothetical protein